MFGFFAVEYWHYCEEWDGVIYFMSFAKETHHNYHLQRTDFTLLLDAT